MSGIVKIHGKDYETVASRLKRFREDHPNWSLITDLVSDGNRVVMKATLLDEKGTIRSTGHAEELRGSSNINETSALENAETSAVGRCLGNFKYTGTDSNPSIATSNEVIDAILQQERKKLDAAKKTFDEERARWIHHNNRVEANYDTIGHVKEALADDDSQRAKEILNQDLLTDEDKYVLWIPYTKGGMFNTKEYNQIKGVKR
tara:strand:+ start:42 stop:653 length:612 start_codon:yes stop_codon:yes gene_type:complete